MRYEEILEIAKTGPQERADDVLLTYQNDFNLDAPALASPNGLLLFKSQRSGREQFGLFDKERLIALLIVIEEAGERSIGRIATTASHQGQGWMRFLITWYVNNVGPLYSDISQSDDAVRMWSTWIKTPGDPMNGGITISLVPEGAAPPVKLTADSNGLIEPNPWDDTDSRLLITKRAYTQESIERHILRETATGRPVFWYGPGTSNDRYHNW